MVEKKTVSQCITSDYCKGWNDAVDGIVRCKDCNRSEKRNGDRYCKYWFDTVDPFHYCSKGERKADNA